MGAFSQMKGVPIIIFLTFLSQQETKAKCELYKTGRNTMEKLGRFLSLVLRHKPQAIGITLDEHGWADVAQLIQKMNENGKAIDIQTLEKIVAENDKKRYAFNEDHTKIRANQGHSIDVNLQLEQKIPPAILYHGTAERFLKNIFAVGLQKMTRQYVHLSKDTETAFKVGKRHGKAVILKIDAQKMYEHGYSFYLSENGVWLCDTVPSQYLEILKR